MNKEYVASRRERKKQDRKYTILKAAREVISKQGLNASIEEIANKADISYPTFYNYFPTKSDLYYAIYLEAIEDIQEFIDIELKNETSAKRSVEKLFEAVMDDFVRYRYLDLFIAGEVFRKEPADDTKEQFSLMFIKTIQPGIDSGEFKKDLDARRYALLIAGIILSATFYDCTREDYRAMLDILLKTMERG